ncbi:MAG: histidine phosphatase family protein [Defluviitaleaceae bacterium]|nr:histidine phosphatase family protein [Defluviitaleaceae bacterium]MCL2274001.1 histidine phosphatase family protein [Defluviitaleaceae bacterium]MCL2274098.1 histidine phosphatase family protein [Defluviitaleaceae bacterium]
MKLLIIRHGQSEGDITGVIEGRYDAELTALGIKQAHLMADWVAERHCIDNIFASPLKRASKVAEILGVRTNLGVTYDPELMEWNTGLISGLSKEEARAKYPAPTIKHPHTALYEQESEIQLRMRAETVLSRLINENPPNATIAVVSHGLFIWNLGYSFLRLPVTASPIRFPIGDTGIHEWHINGEERTVVHVNQRRHLEVLSEEDYSASR